MESKTPIIITKEDCHRCHELKEWLNERDVRYIERDINDEELICLLQGRECGILVLPADETQDVDQRANMFLEELERPVVLVR